MEKYRITVYDQAYKIVDTFAVMAEAHRQHIYFEDILVGVSKAGKRKLESVNKEYIMRDDVPGEPRVVGWE